MSYFSISEDHMEKPMKKVRDHSGSKNPHWNIPHTDSARSKISSTQKLRYKKIAELVEKGMQNQLTEERIMEIVRDTCAQYMAKHAVPVNNNNRKINITL